MSTVGTGFGAFNQASRRLTRMPTNPLDKCTIVSLYPKEIREHKPAIFPGLFVIPAAPFGDFSLLTVGPSSWWKELEENQPYLEIPTSSIRIAESVIRDYANGLLGCDMANKMPGLFFLPGAYTKSTVVTYLDPDTGETFTNKLDKAREKQKNWFMELIQISDVLWARTNGNPLSISDDARMAAKLLQLEKPWMQDFQASQMENCKACGSLVNPAYPVCGNCKAIIDVEKAKSLDIKFAR